MMPETDPVAGGRERIAFRRAMKAFRDSLSSHAMPRDLQLAEPWFATGVGEIGLLAPGDQVVEAWVDINDLGSLLRTGPFPGKVLEPIDAAGAARALGVSLEVGETFLGWVESALRAGIVAYTSATIEFDDDVARRLARNMDMLTRGLEHVAHAYRDHVTLTDEDPLTFGAGHFVLYPVANTHSRFAIEEQYAGTDWSDPDRLATSWTWSAQRHTRQKDGTYRWRVLARGEIQSNDVASLVRRASAWARHTRDLAQRTEPLRRSPSTLRPRNAPQL